MDNRLESATTTATSLDVDQDMGNINKTQSNAKLNKPSSIETSSGSGPRRQDTMGDTIAQTSLKRRVKKLEKKKMSRTYKLKRLYKVRLSARVESFDDKGLGEEDASKQERIIDDLDVDEDITLVNDQKKFDGDKELQALEDLKTSKPKIRGIVIKDHEEPNESRTTTTTTIPKKSHDKGKAKMIEKPVKLKKEDQILFDEEVARKLQEEINKQERLVKVDVDYQLAERKQAEEQQELNEEEKAKLFMELLEKRRKFFAAKRTKEKRNRPPTKALQRSLMIQESADKEPIVNTDTQQEVVTPVKPDDISLSIRITSGRVSKPPQFYYGFYIEKDKISDSTLSELDEPGSIMYVMTCTRPDVSFALSMVSRDQQNPGEGHLTDVKNIRKYLRNNKDRGAVTWKSSKQDTVADSTCESEYIAACKDSKEAIWVKNFIRGLGVIPTVQDLIKILCDNESASRRRHEVESSMSDLSQLRPDAVTNSLTLSLERSRGCRFMLATPSPHSVSTIIQEIWC
nr:hypothetical protein [Tanacetum cinerariifolium]